MTNALLHICNTSCFRGSFENRARHTSSFVYTVCGLCHHPATQGPHRLPASREGPFGWGTDWIAGVGLPGPGGGQAEDVIEPAWCQASPGNRSFVETVMERRVKGPVNTSSRVRRRWWGGRREGLHVSGVFFVCWLCFYCCCFESRGGECTE